jgi:hypothetical protein
MKVLDTMRQNEKEYPWYKIIQGDSLYQGDFLNDFEVLIPEVSTQGDQVAAQCKKLDVVIMTQTCDIVQGNVESLLLCPCWDLWDFIAAAQKKRFNWGKDQREALRRGNLPGYYLSNEADQDGLKMPLTIVDFHEVYTAPTNVVKEFASRTGKRLRLLPPYREHLAQAFARFFMRVGLPVDIAAEKLKTRPT